MKISKHDALRWFEFFAALPEDEELGVQHQAIIYATFAQIETAIDRRNDELVSQIRGLKKLENRTLYVGPEGKFPQGCRSCLLGTGLSAVRKTNRCNLQCNFWVSKTRAVRFLGCILLREESFYSGRRGSLTMVLLFAIIIMEAE
ncbi:MAG: hypothetical protein DDT25_00797 [Chloroflexi bacterium]|nr:hypothetical protein [Chloroflexota bacterium]